MIHIAVCDDESHIIELMQTSLNRLLNGTETQVDSFLSGAEMRDSILAGNHYDLIFLDINLPDMNGIFLARHFRPFIKDSLLIFVSSQDDAVYDSFAAAPFRFLRKSRLDTELPTVVQDALRELQKKTSAVILLQHRQTQISVNPLKVLYIESNLKNQVIHLTDGILEVNYRLKDLEPLFVPYGFIKPHNSFLVNYRFISSIHTRDVLLDNGELLPVSKHRLSELKKAYLMLISFG